MLFSIIIPTYNNYSYLRMTLESILKNSEFKHQMIIHLNGKDFETKKYLEEKGIQYTFSDANIGLCKGVNKASKLSIYDYIVYAHDDMYFLPNWDSYLCDEIKKLKNNLFFFSSIQIGPLPIEDDKPNHIFFNAGENIKNFNENNLLANYNNLDFHDLQGSHWAPHVVHKDLWERVGGFSEEFDPGFGSDPDLNMKLWNEGVRLFKGINLSRTYHFGSLTTRKKKDVLRNNAKKTFLIKWGITIEFFTKYYLKRGEIFSSQLDDFTLSYKNIFPFFICKLKYFFLKKLSN